MTATLFVLGAPDPEMEAIERLLRSANVGLVGYAVGADGKRVTPAGAYALGNVVAIPHPETGELQPLGVSAVPIVLMVECSALVMATSVVRIDHHRPLDPGFGRPPAEFLPASSLGQVIAHLAETGYNFPDWRHTDNQNYPVSRPGMIGHGSFSRTGQWAVGVSAPKPYETGEDASGFPVFSGWPKAIVPPEIVLTAAADHCLGAAYRLECPGVGPEALMRWRARSRAKHQHRSVSAVVADVKATTAALLRAPWLILLPPAEADPTAGLDFRPAVDVRDMRTPAGFCRVCEHGLTPDHTGALECGICAAPSTGPWPELPEAATRAGLAYVAGPVPSPDGRAKYTGSGTPAEISAIMAWMRAEGMADIYGDPMRGFCGGFA